MIIGIGEDLVSISRIQRLLDEKGHSFLQKCFTLSEIEKGESIPLAKNRYAYFAKRFAAKEACLKAIGTGMRDGLSWHDMEISNDPLGRPIIGVSGGVRKKLEMLGSDEFQLHVTLTDEADLAKATVIIEHRGIIPLSTNET